jgi:hypothetical protein
MAHRGFSFVLGLILTGLILMVASHSARACSCARIEPDTAYQQAFLIFTGTAEEITWPTREAIQDGKPVLDPDGRPTFYSEGYVARFSVQEYFKGDSGTKLELRGSGTTCDVGFEVGKRYLVYASQNNKGGLGAFSCSRTMLLDDYAKPDLSYLRRVAGGERPTLLYGFVSRNAWDYAGHNQSEPLSALVVSVEGEGKRLALKTDASGYFETFDLPPGSYRVRTGVTGKLRGAEEQALLITDGGVTSANFQTTSMGSLSGRLLDREGRPAAEALIELWLAKDVPGGRPVDSTSPKEEGRFAFDQVPAGQYVLAVNGSGRKFLSAAPFLASFYPNAGSSADAQVFTIADGASVELGDFVLQGKYPTVAVNGIVITPDGKPVVDAKVSLYKSGGEDAPKSASTDDEGRFVHQAYEGVRYTLQATVVIRRSADGIFESEPIEVLVMKNLEPLRLVIKMPK